MSAVRFGGSEWPLRFPLRVMKELEDYLGEGGAPLRWVPAFLQKIASDDTRSIALAIWAGMGGTGSGLSPLDVLDLIDTASPEEDDSLAGDTIAALQNDLPQPRVGAPQSEGQPWDWRVGHAAWSTEWNQPSDRFWDITLREFSDLSDGRSILYASAKEGGAQSGDTQKVTTMGGWFDLLKMRG